STPRRGPAGSSPTCCCWTCATTRSRPRRPSRSTASAAARWLPTSVTTITSSRAPLRASASATAAPPSTRRRSATTAPSASSCNPFHPSRILIRRHSKERTLNMGETSDRPAVLRRRVARRALLRAGVAAAGSAAALGILGCGPGKGEAPTASSAAAPAPVAPAAPAANPAWDALVAAAKAEGRLVISGSPSAETRRAVPQAFRDRFGIEVEYLAGASSDLAARLQSERAAGQYTIDGCIAGANTTYGTFVANDWLQPIRA